MSNPGITPQTAPGEVSPAATGFTPSPDASPRPVTAGQGPGTHTPTGAAADPMDPAVSPTLDSSSTPGAIATADSSSPAAHLSTPSGHAISPSPGHPSKADDSGGSPASPATPWHTVIVVLTALLLATTLQLRHQGRSWWCACGGLDPVATDIWSPHTSQHLFDPYSFTHILHGVVFCGLLVVAIPRLAVAWRFAAAVALESLWELVENSAFGIERYRTATVSVGYIGDSILNSLADILCCSLGFALAWRLGWRRSLVLYLVVEAGLLLTVRDSLTLNVLMLIHPVESIRAWQMPH